MHKALARTFTKLSRALSREARRFCQRSPAGQTVELSRAQRGDFVRAAPTSQNAERRLREEAEEEKKKHFPVGGARALTPKLPI